ncbi:hypothetical protein BS47DRAFT_842893 [Hydnum rufescens UP504]|uniref:DUF6534 domain-containing protein n=1 Tax=Hydnum rufescens UP504 TaxID=1448309 RepID=A0A9P6AZM1_9AGAM|nr:hypothetical protein BS47DRAFT_842893 [Hydnum rufescens UP504]
MSNRPRIILSQLYYHTFPNDGRPVKMVVGFLWVLEAFQLACCTQAVYWWCVTNYRNPLVLEWSPWEFGIYQINIVSTESVLVVDALILALALSTSRIVCAGPCVTSVRIRGSNRRQSEHGSRISSNSQEDYTACCSMAHYSTSDIVITICMCLLLQRRRTGFRKTDSMINRMLVYTVSTGLVTSVLSCFILVVPLGGFYSVSMLANLHSRTTLQAKLATPNPLN